MTLIFSGNDYKYEIEGVMKLFIPASRFKIVYSDDRPAEEDHAFVCVKERGSEVLLSVVVRYLGKEEKRELSLSAEDKSDRELLLSKLLFQCMSEITGIVPKWGVMTGVRPVKRMNKYLEAGYAKDEIFKIFKDEYYCSEEKAGLAYKTAMVQKPITSSLSDDLFSLYVSIPFCPTRCSYCSFISQTVGSGKKLIAGRSDIPRSFQNGSA